MLKYYLTSFCLSLIAIAVGLFMTGTQPWLLLATLPILVFSLFMIQKEVQTRPDGFKIETVIRKNPDSDKSHGPFTSETLESAHSRICYQINLIAPDARLSQKVFQALQFLNEALPEKILLFFHFNENSLEFTTGLRSGKRKAIDQINSSDPLIEEVLERLSTLSQCASISKGNLPESITEVSHSKSDPAILFVPTRLWNEALGLLVAISTSGEPFKKAEQQVILAFCENMAILLDNHRRFKLEKQHFSASSETELCQKLLSSLLPKSVPVYPGWDIAFTGQYSKDYSGSFHDFVPLGSNKMLVLIGKSSGKGVDAAIFLTRLKAMIKCCALQIKSPADLLNQVSRQLDADEELFATMMAVLIRSDNREVTLACAGHSAPLVNRTRNGYVELTQIDGGIPLGLFNSSSNPYFDQKIQMLPGDGLFIYTDGILEHINKEGKRINIETVKLFLEKLPELEAAQTISQLFNELFLENHASFAPEEDQTGIYLKVE